MTLIGEKLSEIRKRKGMTQESLADAAGINLRTLQRMEAGDTEPRGHTLKSICSVLEIPIEDLLDYGKIDDPNYLAFLHFSVLSFLFLPMGNLLLPLILWQMKKGRIRDLDGQASRLIVVQTIWSLVFWGCFILFALAKLESWSFPMLNGLLFMAVLGFGNIVFPIFVGLRIMQGRVRHYYPGIFPFSS